MPPSLVSGLVLYRNQPFQAILCPHRTASLPAARGADQTNNLESSNSVLKCYVDLFPILLHNYYLVIASGTVCIVEKLSIVTGRTVLSM